MANVGLTIWTIFYGAKNHPPGKWVVRAFDAMDDGTVRHHRLFFECDSLVEARCPRGFPLTSDTRQTIVQSSKPGSDSLGVDSPG